MKSALLMVCKALNKLKNCLELLRYTCVEIRGQIDLTEMEKGSTQLTGQCSVSYINKCKILNAGKGMRKLDQTDLCKILKESQGYRIKWDAVKSQRDDFLLRLSFIKVIT